MKEQEIREKLSEGHILTRMVIEIAGSPKEHVAKTLDILEEALGKVRGINLVKCEKFEPKETEDKKMFTAFVESELLVKDIPTLVGVCFEFMPSSVEIIEPADIRFDANTTSNLLNDVLGRIHNIDMRLKNTNAENTILKKNASALLRNIIKLSLDQSPKDEQSLSKDVGIPVDQLKAFLEVMEKQKEIKKEEEKYSWIKK